MNDSHFGPLSLNNLELVEDVIRFSASKNLQRVALLIRRWNEEETAFVFELQTRQYNGIEYPLCQSLPVTRDSEITLSQDGNYIAYLQEREEQEQLTIRPFEAIETTILSIPVRSAESLCWNHHTLYLFCDAIPEDEWQSVQVMARTMERYAWWRCRKQIAAISLSQATLNPLSDRIMMDASLITVSNDGSMCAYLEHVGYRDAGVGLQLVLQNDESTLDAIPLPNDFITHLAICPSNKHIAWIGSRLSQKPVSRSLSWESASQGVRQSKGINLYDSRVFVLTLETLELIEIEVDETAGIPVGQTQGLTWLSEERLRYVTTHGSTTRLVDYDREARHAQPIRLLEGRSRHHYFGENGDVLMMGSDQGQPHRLYRFNAQDQSLHPTTVLPPAFHAVTPKVLGQGTASESWIYWPTVVQTLQPLVVYVYGGPTPLGQEFDDKLQVLVGEGLAVLVVNPSGSSGYGAQRADAFVNDWGKTAAREVVDTLSAVLATYPCLDADRVGLFGESYGGFLVNQILTFSDRFCAAASVAGFSNIVGYWGSSVAGYQFGLSAQMGSGQEALANMMACSPVFQSTAITTPHLLMHGALDDIVPISESEQLFTALKSQRKEAYLVRFPDSGHRFDDALPTYIAYRNYLVSWFRLKLLGCPENWQALTSEDVDQPI